MPANSALPWAQYTEAVVGLNHPTLPDVANRALRSLLTASGLAPDNPFYGLPVGTKTYNAASYPRGTSGNVPNDNGVAVSSCVAQAVTDGIPFVWVPQSLLPYNATLNAAVHMIGEGRPTDSGVFDLLAYGAATLDAGLRTVMPLIPAMGSVVDCRGLTGTQTFTASVSVNTPYTTFYFPRTTVALGAFQLSVTAGTHGVKFVFPSPWSSASIASGLVLTPPWSYTGSASAIVIGGASAPTRGFYAEDMGIDMSGASGSGAGIVLARVQNYHLVRPCAHQATSNANTMDGIRLDGTGGFTGWGVIEDPVTDNFGGAGGGANINFLNLANANCIFGGECRGVVATGNNGIKVASSQANFIFGLDIDGFVIGIEFQSGATENQFICRSEQNNTTDVQFDSGATKNFVSIPTTPIVVVDNGSGSNIINNAALRTQVGLVTLPSGTSPAIDASLGNYFEQTITSNIAVVVQPPTNPPKSGLAQPITIAFRNGSGGALATAPTFSAGSPGYRLNAAVVNPANGTQVFYTFMYDLAQGLWYETGSHATAM